MKIKKGIGSITNLYGNINFNSNENETNFDLYFKTKRSDILSKKIKPENLLAIIDSVDEFHIKDTSFNWGYGDNLQRWGSGYTPRCCHRMIAIDIDDFTKINKVYGEKIGDKILNETKSLIIKYIPKNSYLVHSRGDEFIILLRSGVPSEDKAWEHKALNDYLTKAVSDLVKGLYIKYTIVFSLREIKCQNNRALDSSDQDNYIIESSNHWLGRSFLEIKRLKKENIEFEIMHCSTGFKETPSIQVTSYVEYFS